MILLVFPVPLTHHRAPGIADTLLEHGDPLRQERRGLRPQPSNVFQEEIDAAAAALDSYTAAAEANASAIAANRAEQERILGVLGELSGAQDEVAEGFCTITRAALDYAAALSGAFNEAHEAAYASLMGQVSLMRGFGQETAITLNQIIANLDSFAAAYKDHAELLQTALENGLDPSIAKRLTCSPLNLSAIVRLRPSLRQR